MSWCKLLLQTKYKGNIVLKSAFALYLANERREDRQGVVVVLNVRLKHFL